MDFPSIAERTERPYISTGHLPEPEMVQRLVSDAHRRFKSNGDGHNSQVYPALARVPRELFGICVAGTSGRVYEAGDTEFKFSIMSVSKPFVFALVCETIGPEEARARLGANATGLPFNSLAAVEQGDGRTNPMVNAGAIATTSLMSPPGHFRLSITRYAGTFGVSTTCRLSAHTKSTRGPLQTIRNRRDWKVAIFVVAIDKCNQHDVDDRRFFAHHCVCFSPGRTGLS